LEDDIHENQVANVSNDIEHELEIVSETLLEISPTRPILSSVSKKDLEIIQKVFDFKILKRMLIIQVSYLTCRRVIERR